MSALDSSQDTAGMTEVAGVAGQGGRVQGAQVRRPQYGSGFFSCGLRVVSKAELA